ncbi:MAG: glutamate 5-kinase [Bacteroidota bacterium]
MKKKLVIKIGSSTLTQETDKISRGKIEDIARQIESLREEYDIVLVSSGAVAAANQIINKNRWAKDVKSKQAKSAIGQPILLQMYNEVFSDYELRPAQCLLTYNDFERETSRENMSNTINELLRHGYIPVVNENDTISVKEIVVGDNDKLSAYVASLISADILILVSDINGIYTKNPHIHNDAVLIPEVSDLKEVEQFIEERESKLGTGGMTTKLEAAQICFDNNVGMYIVNGGANNFILDLLSGKNESTSFRK